MRNSTLTNAHKIRRLADIGEALHGERWQAPLARSLGVSTALMSALANGDRRMTDEFEQRLDLALENEIIPGLEEKTAKLRASLSPSTNSESVGVRMERCAEFYRLTCDEPSISAEARVDEIRAAPTWMDRESAERYVSDRMEELATRRFAEALWEAMPDTKIEVTASELGEDGYSRRVSGIDIRMAYDRVADRIAREQDADLFHLGKLGPEKYGSGWIGVMSAELACSRQHLQDVVSGRTPMSDEMRTRFRTAAGRMAISFEVMARLAKEASEIADAPAALSEDA